MRPRLRGHAALLLVLLPAAPMSLAAQSPRDVPAAARWVARFAAAARTGPGLEYPIVQTYRPGEVVPVRDCNDGWCLLGVLGAYSYVRASDAHLAPVPLSTTPVATPARELLPTPLPALPPLPGLLMTPGLTAWGMATRSAPRPPHVLAVRTPTMSSSQAVDSISARPLTDPTSRAPSQEMAPLDSVRVPTGAAARLDSARGVWAVDSVTVPRRPTAAELRARRAARRALPRRPAATPRR